MTKDNKERPTCPGDEAMEVKMAMFLNALAGQEDSEKAQKTGDSISENAAEYFKEIRPEDRMGDQGRKTLVKDKWNL